MTEDDYLPPSSSGHAAPVTLSPSVSGAIAGLLIGCTILLSACVLMVFNIILFGHGMRGIPRTAAQLGGAIGVCGVAALAVLAVIISGASWSTAGQRKEPRALGFAAFATSLVALFGWLIAGIDLMMILLG